MKKKKSCKISWYCLHIRWKHRMYPDMKMYITGWWFQIYFFMFIPILGRFPFWLIFFQMGWNHQPDKVYTSKILQLIQAPGVHGVSVGGFVEGYFEIMGHLAVSKLQLQLLWSEKFMWRILMIIWLHVNSAWIGDMIDNMLICTYPSRSSRAGMVEGMIDILFWTLDPKNIPNPKTWTSQQSPWGASHFCLVPMGTSSWTNHLYESFFAGCIPVILSFLSKYWKCQSLPESAIRYWVCIWHCRFELLLDL